MNRGGVEQTIGVVPVIEKCVRETEDRRQRPDVRLGAVDQRCIQLDVADREQRQRRPHPEQGRMFGIDPVIVSHERYVTVGEMNRLVPGR
jgi:hypothetical protein